MAAKIETVSLPNIGKEWSKVKDDLKKLAKKKVVGLDAFEAIYKANDRWMNVAVPFNVLRRVLQDGTHVTEEFFCESLLPWIAGKALQVEQLFKETKHKLPVSFLKGRG